MPIVTLTDPIKPLEQYQRFVACLHFTAWTHISLGGHVSLWPLNFEVHLPFCFVRVGMVIDYKMPTEPADGITIYRFGGKEPWWRTIGYQGARK